MTLLAFECVTLQYPVYNSRNMALRNHLVRLGTGGLIEAEAGHVSIVTALRDVSFVLGKGDAVGLVGHNGAGKSTLLRTMAGVYVPVMGHVRRTGRVATVLELGAGMDWELSGYENVIRMGVLLGLSLSEVRERIPEIEAFTELGDFLQLPVRTYSSGMITRLQFAVATSIQPDILLVDEIFGAGDTSFKVKAKQRMENLINSVDIFVLSSHDLDLIRTYCNRFFRLEHGALQEVAAQDILPGLGGGV